MRAKVLQTVLLGIAFGTVSCANGDASIVPSDDTTGGAAGANPSGGNAAVQTGGSSAATGGSNSANAGNAATGGAATGGELATGGVATGGSEATGGAATGGEPATGGSTFGNDTGGSASGGVATGGAETGGSASGGAATGGAETGGVATGGSEAAGGAETGGATTGGAATGGAATGGAATGGAATGGAATGGAATGGAATGGAATGGTSATSTVNPCMMLTPLTGGKQYCSAGTGNAGGGYTYEVSLTPTTTGTTCETVYGKDAAFKSTWNIPNGGDFIGGVGLAFDSTKTYDQLGTLSSDYAFTRTTTGTCYVGIHGSTVSPSAVFYIVEDWNVVRPTFGTKLGTITIDGGQYDVYRYQPLGPPTNPTQYYSVRTTGRHCGHISISEHFKQWATLGVTLGKFADTTMIVEALSATGTVDFTFATVVAN